MMAPTMKAVSCRPAATGAPSLLSNASPNGYEVKRGDRAPYYQVWCHSRSSRFRFRQPAHDEGRVHLLGQDNPEARLSFTWRAGIEPGAQEIIPRVVREDVGPPE